MVDKEKITRLINEIEQCLETNCECCYKGLFGDVLSENDYNPFIKELSKVKEKIDLDVEFFQKCDPAANSKEEIKLAYPGYKAILTYRIAHILFEFGYKVEARIMSEQAHTLTGIDIHPGANIGCPFFIDHGTGIVIGETAIVGSRVRIYQGVTLGALSLAKGAELKGNKRHPTVKDDVIIYSGASILGDITIGNNVTIGSNVFLLESIPDNRKVTLPNPVLIVKEK